jgi:AraC family transcriptional regulator of adaptative response / DNA-3-methyladenine glycosylase II
MLLDQRACDRARRSRDARFDGRFFIAVTTTRVYCRPICPARAPKDAHVRYFATAAAAEAAGFRPCLRCRPEASPARPRGSARRASCRARCGLIADGALDEASVDALADRLGVTARHLRRLFLHHLGATPSDVALTRRVHFAKKLLDETSLPFKEVAFAAGFGSVRRFNGQIRRTYRRTPSELRRLARQAPPVEPGCYRFRLSYRPPYDWSAVLAFLRARATPGVEVVDDVSYRRTIAVDRQPGVIASPATTRARRSTSTCGFPIPAHCCRLSNGCGGCSILAPIPRSSPDTCTSTRCCAALSHSIRESERLGRGMVSSWRYAPSSASRSRCAARRRSRDAWRRCGGLGLMAAQDSCGCFRHRCS